MAKKIRKFHYASSYNKYFVTTKFVPNCDFHYHTFYEIEIILSGRIISFINGEKFVLVRGDAMCLLPSDVHNIIVEKKAEIFNMSFCANEENMECINRIFYYNNEKKFHICEKDLDIVCDILRKIIDEQPIQTKIENKFIRCGSLPCYPQCRLHLRFKQRSPTCKINTIYSGALYRGYFP